MDGTQLLEEHDCSLVELPDGRPAAIWRGLAFPLLPGGNAIDVSEDGVPPSSCRPADAPTPPRTTGFVVEAADDEAYILLPGSGLEIARAAKNLQRAGLEVLRTGRHYGDHAGGIAADWFVKIVVPDGTPDLKAIIGRALGHSSSDEPVSFDRAGLLRSELLAARSREAFAREEVARLRLALGDVASASAQDIATLRAELAEESARRSAAEAEALQVAPTPVVVPGPMGRAGPAIRDEIRDVVEALLPNLVFLKSSLDVLAFEFSGRRSVYRILNQLACADSGRPREGKWKTLANCGEWIESHVSNGNDNAGRVYARLNAGARGWSVLLSHKGQQARDVAWLRAQG